MSTETLEVKAQRVHSRFIEILNMIDYTYITALSHAIEEESKILSKDRLDEVDQVKLIGIKAIKNLVARELGLK